MMKKLGRKQLVLASLVLALGAAVYLNWQFAGLWATAPGTQAASWGRPSW